jgi:hypothetical protein
MSGLLLMYKIAEITKLRIVTIMTHLIAFTLENKNTDHAAGTINSDSFEEEF